MGLRGPGAPPLDSVGIEQLSDRRHVDDVPEPVRSECVYLLMARRHVHMTLDPDVYDRARSVVDRLPGATISGLFDQYLSELVPVLEKILSAVDEGNAEAAQAVLSGYLGERLVHMMVSGGEETG